MDDRLADPAPHRSPIFELSSRYVDALARANPIAATAMGIAGYEDELTDFSTAAQTERAELSRTALRELADLTDRTDGSRSLDEIDAVAAGCLQERLDSALELHDSGEYLRSMNVLASPASAIREVFDLMPTDGTESRSRIEARLAAIPASLASWRSSLVDGVEAGQVCARRQALAVASQCDAYGAADGRGWFSGYVRGLGDAAHLAPLAESAESAYRDLGIFLRETYAPRADEVDPIGRDRYARCARAWNGAALDLDATWEWGWDELDRIRERMRSVAELVSPGLELRDAREYLNADPKYVIEGTDALLAYLIDLTERTTEEMDGRYFDIDPRIRQCDVKLAAEGGAAAPYYIPPSEDLSRPGSTWYPTLGHNTFPIWWAVSVWYHEAVPGHHLQCAVSTLQRDRQSRFQRLAGWTSGYGEGWALYAERLMNELGYFDDPGIELGYLSSQAMRAARVVLDIGAHLQLRIPEGRGDLSGRTFDRDLMVDFLTDQALLAEDFASSEADRYLGLAGQAISYKVGERVWLDTREAAKQRLGGAFDLKHWHSYGLALGPMGLDPFAALMGGYTGREVLA